MLESLCEQCREGIIKQVMTDGMGRMMMGRVVVFGDSADGYFTGKRMVGGDLSSASLCAPAAKVDFLDGRSSPTRA